MSDPLKLNAAFIAKIQEVDDEPELQPFAISPMERLYPEEFVPEVRERWRFGKATTLAAATAGASYLKAKLREASMWRSIMPPRMVGP